jgi:hypothetical protein
MKRTPTDFHFIVITTLLVLLIGVRTVYSLADDDSVNLVTEATVPVVSLSASERSPASLPAKILEEKTSLHRMMSMDLSCTQKQYSVFKVSGHFVQFKGKNCLKNFKQDFMEIVNRSNGYTASIFSFGNDQYQTDMIQLVDGENEITVRYESPTGLKYEKTIKVSSSSI